MEYDANNFFSAVISAGAILAGFCGTFLAFRIEREASYYRQPGDNDQNPEGSGIANKSHNLTHFTSSLLLLILATVVSIFFGVLIPLFALANPLLWVAQVPLVVAGLVAAIVLVLGYFLDELVHYHVFKFLKNTSDEWKRESPVWFGTILGAVVAGSCTYFLM